MSETYMSNSSGSAKVIRDGKVAVILGENGRWGSLAKTTGTPEMLFCPEMVYALLEGDRFQMRKLPQANQAAHEIANLKFPEFDMPEQFEVHWGYFSCSLQSK